MAYTIYQKAGQRFNATAFNEALQTAIFYEDYAVSSRTAIVVGTKKNNRVMLPLNNNKEFLQLQVGVIKTDLGISSGDTDRVTTDFEDNGSGFPEELDWMNIYSDGASVGTVTKTVNYFSKTVYKEEENGLVKYEIKVTATHYSFTTATGEHIQLENCVYAGTKEYLSNVYFVNYNNQATSYNPAYKGEVIGDIVDSVTDNLLNENTELFASIPLHKMEETTAESVFEIGHGVLSNCDVDDALIFRFVAKDSSVYLYNGSRSQTFDPPSTGDYLRIVTDDGVVHQAPEGAIQLTPYKTVGTDYYYEFSIYKADDEDLSSQLAMLFYFYTDIAAETKADIRYAVFLQAMHYNRCRAVPSGFNAVRCNYPSSYSANSAIHQQLINDFINVTKRNYFVSPVSSFATSVLSSSANDNYRVFVNNAPYSVIASDSIEDPTITISSRNAEIIVK